MSDPSQSDPYPSTVERPELIIPGEPRPDEPGEQGEQEEPTESVEQPAKVMRIGSMVKQLLDEVRAAPLDEREPRAAARRSTRRRSTSSARALSPDLQDELDRLALPFDEDDVPSEAELRVAQAQLVGWLEGLFHGIQATLFAQQMAARQQLEQLRQLPGPAPPGRRPADGPGARRRPAPICERPGADRRAPASASTLWIVRSAVSHSLWIRRRCD